VAVTRRRRATSWDVIAYRGLNACLVGFLLLPILVVLLFSINPAPFIQFPPQGVSLRWFVKFFESRDFMAAFRLSVELAALTVIGATVIGTMAALALVRGRLPGAGFLAGLFLSPLMLPAILTGLALFQLYVLLDVGRPFWGLLIGHVVIAIPYVIRTTVAVLTNFDRSIEEAARNLGASELVTFREVTLPLIRPGVIAGGIFAFVISFDQFPLSLFLVNPGQETLPITMFNYLRYDFDPTIAAASTVSIALSIAVVLLLERTIGLQDYVKL
jgi:putative spermidine/putrescine transport system permease protein